MAAIINMAEGAAPSAPSAGTHILYVATDGAWHILDEAASDRTLLTTDATPTIADGSIVNADLADMAEATVKGRAAGAGTGVPVDLTAAQLVTMLGSAVGALLPATADWQTLPLSSSGVSAAATIAGHSFPVPQYCSLGGLVFLRGNIAHSDGGWLTIGTLPEGYRPEYNCVHLEMRYVSTTFVVNCVAIGSDGAVKAYYASSHALDGICFVAA